MNIRVGKPDLLFLCHRIPYPPDKGDKIRSYHWLLALAGSFRVHLAAFVDDPEDWAHRGPLETLCDSSLLLPLNPVAGKARSLAGLLTGEALTLPYYRDRRMTRWLNQLWRHQDIRHLVVYSSAMAQYVTGPPFDQARRVIDFVDVDSDKWQQYADHRSGLISWVYSREAARLSAFDASIARAFDLSLFVSSTEAAWFRGRFDMAGGSVTHVSNGVDSSHFDPRHGGDSPYPEGARALVFTGVMDYWANLDAVVWFAREVWPRIRTAVPGAVFYIVGSRPSPRVRALAGSGVVVTGRVPDVRPFLHHAEVVVVPMRISRGIQNKVLEAMSMARPVVVTTRGLEGVSARDGRELFVADDAGDFTHRILDLLAGNAAATGEAARLLVRRDYDWETSCLRLIHLVKGDQDSSTAEVTRRSHATE